MPATRLLSQSELTKLLPRIESFDVAQSEEANFTAGVEHERITFPSYPHEWCPEMLWKAAELTLDIAEALQREGMGLKDATPHNLLFRGPKPVFVDILSIERRTPGDAYWAPFGQFVRTFLTPLLVHRHFNLPLEMIYLARRDGLEPENVYSLCNVFQLFTQPFFSLVTMPYWLARLGGKKRPRLRNAPTELSSYAAEKAQFVFASLLRHLRRLLHHVIPAKPLRSRWSGYMEKELPYSKAQFKAKAEFVKTALDEIKPLQVLDVGCNTGFFSRMAAESGSSVVAIDSDEAVVSRLWREADKLNLDILSLCVNLNRPSPSLGWENRESASFLSRARGNFDLVCMLAVIHHIVHGDGVSLPEAMRLASELTRSHLIIEFMDPQDPSVLAIASRRTYTRTITRGWFEETARQFFDIIRQMDVPSGTRTLYLMRKKNA